MTANISMHLIRLDRLCCFGVPVINAPRQGDSSTMNEIHHDASTPMKDWLTEHQKDAHFFLENLRGAEFHWFFVQAVHALHYDLYIPAISSLFNGIEATLRVTLCQIANPHDQQPPSPYRVLSNRLILDAHAHGMPVEKLAFMDESDFFEKLRSAKPSRTDVEIVRLRNNICHGDVFEFINQDLGEGNHFFTPECLRDLAGSLLGVSRQWALALGKFRHERFRA